MARGKLITISSMLLYMMSLFEMSIDKSNDEWLVNFCCHDCEKEDNGIYKYTNFFLVIKLIQ